MKKLLVLTLALVMTLSIGYVTLASTYGIGATKGFQVEIGTVVDPSDYTDDVDITGYYGLNEKTQFSVSYATDCKDITLGARYAFAENMAVTLDYYMPDADGADEIAKLGYRYKAQISDPLALVGLLYYSDTDPDAKIDAIGQAEYAFTKKVVGTLGFDFYKIDDVDGTDITVGVETYPVDKLTVYLDYTMPDDEDTDEDNAYLGVSYAF